MSQKLADHLIRITLSLFAAATPWGCDEGVADSSTESEAAGCSLVGTTAWWNQSFPEQTAMFHVELEANPSMARMDAVVGLSNGAATHWNKLAAIVRFNPAGTLDARDGDVYRADQVWSYQPGTALRFRFDVDVRTHTYSVYWKAGGYQDTYRVIGRNFRFRTEQAAITRLTNIASFVNPDTGARGTLNVCNTNVVRDMTTADGCTIINAGTGFTNQPVAASSQVMVVDVQAKAGAANIDAVFGVTTGPADDYNDMAAAVRFYANGRLEVRDASTYRADSVVTYQPGDLFSLRFVIDLWSRKYSVFASGPGIPEAVALARDYRFRPQATGTTLDHVTSIVASSTGRFDTCNASGRDAAPAVHARTGRFDVWPLSGEGVLISNATSTMWIDAVGRVQRTLPRGGEIAADQFANYYLTNAQPAGVLAVEALSPTFTTRWSRTYAIPADSTVSDSTIFADGTLGVHITGGSGPTIERIASDGTYVGRTPLSPSIVSLDAQGYAALIFDGTGANGVTIERHRPDGSLVWSRSYPGPYSPSDLATAPDGSIVFTGWNAGEFQFGPSLIQHSSSSDADNSFVASLSASGEARFAERIDATWFGGLATNGTRLVVARQKAIGPIINDYLVYNVSGGIVDGFSGNGLSAFGRSHDVAIGTAHRVYTNSTMTWPENFTHWDFFVGLGR